MPNLTLAYQWAIDICNAPNIGYSQTYRNQQTVNGITYYDCSSFINYSLLAGGWETPGYAPNNNAFTTYTMESVLQGLGFASVPVSDPWLPGDILVRNNSYGNHTEMVYQDRYTMGAHGTGYPLDDQVSIKNTVSNPATWDTCWRYGTPVTYEWITGNRYLTEEEMQNNAIVQYADLSAKGWSLNAIAGLMGNENRESRINPGVWQNLDPSRPDLGYGLVQWTPSTNITNWLTANGYEWDDGYAQDIALDLQIPAGQWIPTSSFPISYEDWKTTDSSPEDAGLAFLYNFERPLDTSQFETQVRNDSRKWYDFLLTVGPVVPGKPKPIPDWNISGMLQYGFMASKNRRKRNNDNSGHTYII